MTDREFQNVVDDIFRHLEDIEPYAYAEYAELDAEIDAKYYAAIDADSYPSEVLA